MPRPVVQSVVREANDLANLRYVMARLRESKKIPEKTKVKLIQSLLTTCRALEDHGYGILRTKVNGAKSA